ARHLTPVPGIDRVLLPGLCAGDLAGLNAAFQAPVERGPKDLRDLPDFFGNRGKVADTYGAYDIEILAEINHAPRMPFAAILTQPRACRTAGADVIDLGCDPGETWADTGATVRTLRDEGLRVSIDSFNPREVEAAVAGGAELVLSVNRTNREAARSWGCEVVV